MPCTHLASIAPGIALLRMATHPRQRSQVQEPVGHLAPRSPGVRRDGQTRTGAQAAALEPWDGHNTCGRRNEWWWVSRARRASSTESGDSKVLRSLQIGTHLVISKAGELTRAHETDLSSAALRNLASRHYAVGDAGAALASGSLRSMGMIIAPLHSPTERDRDRRHGQPADTRRPTSMLIA